MIKFDIESTNGTEVETKYFRSTGEYVLQESKKEIIMQILSVIFWIAIGLLYLGITFPLQLILIGICALVIGIVGLVGLFR